MAAPPGAAEESAIASVNKILTDAGQHLWQKYLTRKSFSFAKKVAEEVSISEVVMCCPGHDNADNLNDWMIEDEPNPTDPDCWARMILRTPQEEARISEEKTEDRSCPQVERGSTTVDEAAATILRAQSAPTLGDLQARRRTVHSTNSETSSTSSRSGSRSFMKVNSMSGRSKPKDSRAFLLPDFYVVDEVEDKLRLAKARQEARKRAQEEEERRLQLLEEEEERRQEAKRKADAEDPKSYTFGTDGKMILIQEPDPEALPEVMPLVQHEVEVTANDLISPHDFIFRSSQLPPSPAPNPNSKRKGRGKKEKGKDKEDPNGFTDSFYKPEYMQPPPMDTMRVQPGVVLESGGQKKSGPMLRSPEKRQMSRREYFRMVEGRDASTDLRPSSASGGGSSELQKKSATEGSKRPGSAPGSQRANAPPPLNLSRTSQEGQALADARALEAGASHDRSSTGEKHSSTLQSSTTEPGVTKVGLGLKAARPLIIGFGPQDAKNQKAPPAPAWSVRVNSRALSKDVRPPRYHVAALGGSSNTGLSQPPIGATMGHGLLRNKSTKQSYFFPPKGSEPSSPERKQLTRASSAPAVSRKHS